MNININPNSELHQSIVDVPEDMVQVPEMWVDPGSPVPAGYDEVYLCNQGGQDKAGSVE